jgi:hypothetical protein
MPFNFPSFRALVDLLRLLGILHTPEPVAAPDPVAAAVAPDPLEEALELTLTLRRQNHQHNYPGSVSLHRQEELLDETKDIRDDDDQFFLLRLSRVKL